MLFASVLTFLYYNSTDNNDHLLLKNTTKLKSFIKNNFFYPPKMDGSFWNDYKMKVERLSKEFNGKHNVSWI